MVPEHRGNVSMRAVSMQVFFQASSCTKIVLSGLQKHKKALELPNYHTSALKCPGAYTKTDAKRTIST